MTSSILTPISKVTGMGVALCCGRVPTQLRNGFQCSVCDFKSLGWSENIPWLASLWNKARHKTEWKKHGEHWSEKTLIYHNAPELDLPGWKYAELNYVYHPAWGAKTEGNLDFALFKVPGRSDESLLKSAEDYEYIINESRCISEFRLRTITGSEIDIKFPKFKTSPSVQMHISRGWCTDNTWWYTVNICTYNHKWHSIMIEALGAAGKFDVSNLK